MTLRAAAGWIVVEPTGDNNESEEGRLIVVQNNQPRHTIYRGVALHVGDHVHDENATEGSVAHYTDFRELHGKHLVPCNHVLAWEAETW